MVPAAHAVLATVALAVLWRGLERPAFVGNAPDPQVASAFALAVLIASAAGSVGAIVAGRTAWSPARALLFDAVSLAAAGWAFAVVSLGPWTRELGGVSLVAIAAIRLAPAALAVVSGRAPAWLALLASFGAYAALAAWLSVASLPFGDQVHYLLLADALAHGRIDLTIDAQLFVQLLGVPPSAVDAATHVANAPVGPRPIQGYALSLLILPGWQIAGRVGAGIALAMVGAWTSYQILLILRDLLPSRPRVVGATWSIATACAPLSLLATHIYPNVVGAALIATAYRCGFTAPTRRPVLAAAILALTLFLTPRDAVALLVLLPFLLRERITRVRVSAAAAAIAFLVIALSAILYGLPIPYAGYAFGTAQAQEITREGSITPLVWVTLPAILFDRTFGLAGSAAWVFLGLLGFVPALRADGGRLLPAALAVGASVLALSFFRLWEGGYAPPARYFVDVLPLWTPFVAYGLIAARGWIERGVAGVLVGVSALTSLVLNAVPSLALNTAFDDKIRDAIGRVLGLDPLAWLPSFQPVVPSWYVPAYFTLLPAAAMTIWLVWVGAQSLPRVRSSPEEGALSTMAPAVSRSRALEARHVNGHRNGVDRHRSGVETHASLNERAWSFSWANSLAGSEIALFLVVNLVAIGWVVVATAQPWIGLGPDPVSESLLRKWLPLSLALAAAGTALISRSLAPAERASVLTRHFWLYLVPLGLMLLAHFSGGGVANGQLGAVYLLLAVGYVVHALWALWPVLGQLGDRAAALQLAGVALVAMIVLLPYHRAVMPTASDEPHYLLVTQSLLYDGDLDVRNDYEGDRYSAFYPARLPDMHGVEVGRAVFSIRDPALPIVSVVPFALGGRLGVLAFMCLVGAALVAQLYLLLRDLRFVPRVAFLATATTALVHPIYTYTTQVYPELLTVLAFVTAVRVMRSGERSTLRDLAVASALVGTLPWLSTRAWPIVVGLGLVLAYCALRPWPSDRRFLAARVAAGALPFVALVLALSFVNWRTFGLFMPSAGYFLIREGQPVLTFTPWIGAPGLLFDRVFGLIPRAPVYLLAFVGLIPLWRRARAGHGVQIAALGAGSLLSFVYIADIAYWWADGSPPSRYALGSIPLLIAGVAGGWEIVSARPWPRAAAWLAVIASAVVAYLYAVLPNIRYDLALDVRAAGSSGGLFDFLARATGVDGGLVFPSLVRADLLSVALTLAWIAVAVGLVLAGRRAQPAG